MDKVQRNIDRLMKEMPWNYMRDVRSCALRENERCGHTSSCRVCPHYLMVKRMRQEFEQLNADDTPIDFYTISGNLNHIQNYIDEFEVDLA